MSDTFNFRPIPTISALDLALIIANGGGLQGVSYDFIKSLPFDTARHFQPALPQLPLSDGPRLILDEATNTAGNG